MKEISKIGFQGDVMFERVRSVPASAKRVERTGDLVVAHSETGHHHVIRALDVECWEEPKNPLICYLRLGNDLADVEHLRAWDTHETVRLLGKPSTVYKVRRQREWSPEGWRKAAD